MPVRHVKKFKSLRIYIKPERIIRDFKTTSHKTKNTIEHGIYKCLAHNNRGSYNRNQKGFIPGGLV